MNYNKWESEVPETIKNDILWKLESYRLSLFLSDISWKDVTKLSKDRRTLSLSDQLYRSVGSISSNIAEGYSRGTGKDRARFYEYSLGSAREARDWYFKSRFILGEKVVNHRLDLTTQIIRLLLKMVPEQRGASSKEDSKEYVYNEILLNNIPFTKD